MIDAIDEHALLFGIRRSIRYHNRRRMFFERINKLNQFLSALSATAVIAAVLGKLGRFPEVAFSACVVFFSVLDLVISSSQMARLHSDLYGLFVGLERDITLVNGPCTDEQLRHFYARRLEIEAKEPSVLTALNLICHNELVKAGGYETKHLIEIPPWKAFLADVISFDGLAQN